MSKGVRILIVVLVVAAAGAFFFINIKRPAMAGGKSKPEQVRLEKVEKRTLTAVVRAPGRVQPAEYVNLSAQVPGRIVELAVEEGDTVQAGDLLIRLDDTQYRATVESSRAAAKSAAASVRLAEARLEQANLDLNRQKKLAASNMVSPEAVDRAQTDVKVAQAELSARQEEQTRSEAMVKAAVDDLSKTVYSAPTAGVISALNVKVGEIVITGTMNNPGTVILTIADRSRMEVEAQVDETDVVDIKAGQEARLTVDALPDTTFKGTVKTIGASAELGAAATAESATNFKVEILFNDDIPQLRPGMTADVEIVTQSRDSVMAVPIAALVARDPKTIERQKKSLEERKAGGGKAMASDKKKKGGEEEEVASPGGKPEKLLEGIFINRSGEAIFVPVKTGIADDTHIEVLGDVSVGQEIVTGPYKTLRELKYGAAIKKAKNLKESKKRG